MPEPDSPNPPTATPGPAHEAPIGPSASALEPLPPGQALSLQQIAEITRGQYTPLVLLAGAVGSGKTTLLASLQDCFHRGTFADFAFAGSKTTVALEEKCFDARVASGATVPTTPRTTHQMGQHFYHFRVSDVHDPGRIREVLIEDMSGEFFERALESAEETRELRTARRPDHVALLLDGERLLRTAERTAVRSNGSMLVRRLLEADLLQKHSRLDVLITKWDLIVGTPDGSLETDVESFVQPFFSHRYAGKLARVRVAKISARPASGSRLPPAYNVDPLFRSWVSDPLVELSRPIKQLGACISSRMFDRFAN